MAHLQREITLAAGAEEIFDFVIRPENAAKLTAPDAGLKTISAPEILEQGSRIELELTGFGPPQRFLYEVSELIHADRYVETLIKGPLSSFRHAHGFEAVSQGTRITDEIEFTPPGGMLGFLLSEDRIRGGLDQGLTYRHEQLGEIFGLA